MIISNYAAHFKKTGSNLQEHVLNTTHFLFALTLGFSIHAQAAESVDKQLITPTLWAETPDKFACNLTNVSKKTRTIRVRIITNGEILHDSGMISVAPLHTSDRFVDGLVGGGPIYCEFTVEGAKKWYRGAAKLFSDSPNTSDFLVIPAE